MVHHPLHAADLWRCADGAKLRLAEIKNKRGTGRGVLFQNEGHRPNQTLHWTPPQIVFPTKASRCAESIGTTISVMHRFISFVLCLMVGSLSGAGDRPAQSPPVTHYDPDPAHLWNRLHATLFIRPDRDGTPVGLDVLDPIVFPTTKRLLEGPTHAEAVKLLDEFLAGGHELVRDPVKRSVMQRDLWAVFDWAAYPFGNFYILDGGTAIRTGPLQERLAKAVRKLALAKAGAEALPDTYAIAVKSKAFPIAFDPTRPNDPFLPPDLFDPDGPWVCVTGPRDMPTPVAANHATIFGGRSVFLVFIKLPEGRKATLAYLDTLNTFPKPWKVLPVKNDEGETGQRPPRPQVNPDVPQVPTATQVALVRQAVVVTEDGKLVATSLTESVQLRTIRKLAARSRTYEEQAMVEFKLRRADLFAGKNGGLHATRSDDLTTPAVSVLGSWSDPYETKRDDIHNRPEPAHQRCASCHSHEGIHSVFSYTQHGAATPTQTLGLFPVGFGDVRTRSAEWKAGLKDWAELRKLTGW